MRSRTGIQAQGVALLQPIFTVSDAYLNLFRGIVPPLIFAVPSGAVFFGGRLLHWGTQGRAAEELRPRSSLSCTSTAGVVGAADAFGRSTHVHEMVR